MISNDQAMVAGIPDPCHITEPQSEMTPSEGQAQRQDRKSALHVSKYCLKIRVHNGLLGCHGGHFVFGCVKTRPIAKELRPMPGPPQKLALCPSFSLFLGHMSPACIVNSECFQHTFHPRNILSDYFLCIFSRVTPTDQKENKGTPQRLMLST